MELLFGVLKFFVPLIIVAALVAKVVHARHKRDPIYNSTAGVAKRDAINETYRVNLVAKVIKYLTVVLWLLVAGVILYEQGVNVFSILVGLLAAIPVAVAGLAILATYILAVHIYANVFQKSPGNS